MGDTDALWGAEADPASGGTLPAGAPSPNGDGGDPSVAGAPAPALDVNQLGEMLAKRDEELRAENRAELQQAIGQISQQLGQQLAPQQEPVDPSQLSSDLFADPEKTVGEIADRRVQDAISREVVPRTQIAVEALGNMLIQNERERIDSRFGEGAFKEYVEADLRDIMGKIRANDAYNVGNEEAVRNAVQLVMGVPEKMEGLVEYKAKAAESQKGASETEIKRVAELVTTNLSGHMPFSTVGDDGALTEEMRDFVARNAASGVEISPDDLQRSRKMGNSLKSYRASLPAKEKA